MSVIATEGKKVSDLLVNELWADLGYCRTTYTYNGAAKTFAIGELVTAVGGVLIDGSSSAIINSPYGALQFVFNGTEWNIV